MDKLNSSSLIDLAVWLGVGLIVLIAAVVGAMLLREPFTFWQFRRQAGELKTCSWLKAVPADWTCSDNWSDTHRVARAEKDHQILELHIADEVAAPCQSRRPFSFWYNPSPSGITRPERCLGDNLNVVTATWTQDGSVFRLTGTNLDAQFYLLNLDLVGEAFFNL